MTCLRGVAVCILALAALMSSVSEVMGADDFMVMRYSDGFIQRIKLERPSESIRQIEFPEGKRVFGVLRYTDGSTQRIKLERRSESIRQIEFLEGRRVSGRDDRGDGRIKVIAATYGRNCGAPYGNVTRHLAENCDGMPVCEYVIDFRVIGDPAAGCAKDYLAEWQCGRDPERHTLGVGPEAGGGARILLRCPAR